MCVAAAELGVGQLRDDRAQIRPEPFGLDLRQRGEKVSVGPKSVEHGLAADLSLGLVAERLVLRRFRRPGRESQFAQKPVRQGIISPLHGLTCVGKGFVERAAVRPLPPRPCVRRSAATGRRRSHFLRPFPSQVANTAAAVSGRYSTSRSPAHSPEPAGRCAASADSILGRGQRRGARRRPQ